MNILLKVDLTNLANKTTKSTPRIVPKNASTYSPGDEIRIELPAQGYLNPGNTTLTFDVDLTYTPVANDGSIIRFQDNIQSLFQRVRLMYGSTPLEDIVDYNLIVRKMTQWTASATFDQGSICDGIAEEAVSTDGGFGNVSYAMGPVHGRLKYVQGISLQTPNTLLGTPPANNRPQFASRGFGVVPSGTNSNATASQEIKTTRRYTVQLALGIFQQGKYVPIKYMASQLALLINLAPAKDCIIWQKGKTINAGTWTDAFNSSVSPSYAVKNVALLPEILEFDSSYDSSFIEGLKKGIPIKFSTWDTFRYSVSAGTSMTFQVPERHRSVKSIFALQVRAQTDFDYDSGASFYTSNIEDVSSTLVEYWYRIGGRYFLNN
jgi:hypothetical protein